MNQFCYRCGHSLEFHKSRVAMYSAMTFCYEHTCFCFEFQSEPKEFALGVEGYPTESTIYQIKNWPYQEAAKLFEWIEPYWMEHGNLRRKRGYVILATGGWSGNEEILSAIEENVIIRTFWVASFRGGKVIYQLPSDDHGADQPSDEPAQPSAPA